MTVLSHQPPAVRRLRWVGTDTLKSGEADQWVERAKDLLAHANLTVTEVCMLVGFSSLSSFSRRFRALVGCWPSEYQRRAAPPAIPGCIAMAWGRPAIADKHVDGPRS